MEKKKKILLHSNSCLGNTGFGRHNKVLLSYLYKTGKYDLVEYAAGPLTWSHPICKSMPWPCYGALPDNPKEMEPYAHDLNLLQSIKYGEYYINRVVEQEKPDVIILMEDIWGIQHWNKPWIGKTTHVFWTPVDSLPLYPMLIHNKDKFGNLWVKARFAQEALEKEGIKSKYMPALIDNTQFKILSDEERQNLRKRFGVSKDTIVFGFVFRNQLRKLVNVLLESFSEFKKRNPDTPAKLFLHTNWAEGWDIPELMKRFGVKREDVLTTHICAKCRSYTLRPFYGQETNCRFCGSEKTVNTTNTDVGVEEEDLCKLYNICDAYIHPITSGGFEFPVAEAMFCGLPVAVTEYSCGSNFTINPDVFPLKYFIYQEGGSLFDKAFVDKNSVIEFMEKIKNMTQEERRNLGQKLSNWALEQFDYRKICKEVEDFIDEQPFTDYKFNFSDLKNENYPMPEITDNYEFIIDLYRNILNMDVVNNTNEIENAMSMFKQGMSQEQIYNKFLEVARNLNEKNKKISLQDLIDNNSTKKRLLYVEPGGFGDCVESVSVLEALSKKYDPKEWDFYVASKVSEIFDHLEFIKKKIPYEEFLDDVLAMEGIGDHNGFFDVAYHSRTIRGSLDFFKNNNA